MDGLKADNTLGRSQAVLHPITNWALRRLTERRGGNFSQLVNVNSERRGGKFSQAVHVSTERRGGKLSRAVNVNTERRGGKFSHGGDCKHRTARRKVFPGVNGNT